MNAPDGPYAQMRVVVLSHTFVVRQNGTWLTKDRVAESIHGLADAGWHVTYVARESTPLSYIREGLDPRITVIPISRGLASIGSLVRTMRAIGTAHPALVFMPTVRTACAAIIVGSRCVMYAGNAWSEIPQTAGWRRRLEEWAAHRVSLVIAAGSRTQARFQPYARAVEAAVPMVPGEVGRRIREGAEVSATRRSSDSSLNVLFVGSLMKRKGILAVIDAVKAVPGTSCRIIGPPGDDDIEAILDEASGHPRITVSGYLHWNELRDAYQWADALVLPSAVEGFPRVVYEATAFDTAVVVSPVGGVAERLQDGRDALFVPPGDAQALELALRKIQQQPAIVADLAASAKRSLSNAFAYDNTSQQFGNALSQVMRSESRDRA